MNKSKPIFYHQDDVAVLANALRTANQLLTVLGPSPESCDSPEQIKGWGEVKEAIERYDENFSRTTRCTDGCIITEGGDCHGPTLCNQIESLQEAGREVARLLSLADSLATNVAWWGDTTLAGRRKTTHREEATIALHEWHKLVRPQTKAQRDAAHDGSMLS